MKRTTSAGRALAVALLAVTVTLDTAYAGPMAAYNGHYYQLINTFASPVTWEQANTAANAMTYNGLSGHLATFNSEAEFNAVKTAYGTTLNTPIGAAYVGAQIVGSTWNWVNHEGAVSFTGWTAPLTAASGSDGQGGKLDLLTTINPISTASVTAFYSIIEYQTVPEPTSLALLGFGCAALLGRRRLSRT